MKITTKEMLCDIEMYTGKTDTALANKFGVCRETINRWKHGVEPKDESTRKAIERAYQEAKAIYECKLVGTDIHAKDEPHEITVTFKPKFKTGDKVKTLDGEIGRIDKCVRAGVGFDENMRAKVKYLTYWVKVDHGYEHWEEDGLKLYTQPDKPKWTFTEDEKVILRNLPEEYQYIVRDESGSLTVWTDKPKKAIYTWKGGNVFIHFDEYGHLFRCIQWTDDEPCEFRKYL